MLLAARFIIACGGDGGPTDPPPPGAVPPPASAGHNLVWAEDLEMVLLVNAGLGGSPAPAATAATRVWGWKGTAWQLLDSLGPPVRNLAGAAYDSRRHMLVIHGGSYDLGRSYGETWEWSPSTGWRRFTGTNPGIRDHTGMAYDPERGRAVLFGGSGTDPNVAFSDVWEFDGTRWERFTPTGGPAARVHHAVSYDPASHSVLVFGGFTPGSADLGDTWSWNGTRWTQVAQTSPRTHARMTYDARLGATVLVGGFGTSLGVLTLRSGTWSANTASPTPSARYLTDVAYDTRRQKLVVFGGGDPNGNTIFSDTWEMDATGWVKKAQ